MKRLFLAMQDAIDRRLRKHLKHSVRIKSALYRLLWLLPERWRRTDAIREALKALDTENRPISFVNIGANDGLAGDPLHEFVIRRRWTGILVEPVPFVFTRLQKVYRHRTGVTCEHAAIADHDGTRTFWYVRQNNLLTPGYDQIGSFDREQVAAHDQGLFPGVSAFIDSMQVPTLTLDSLLAKHGIRGVDVFLIDTEGYDAHIVNQIDLARWNPRLIIYEHKHVPTAEQAPCAERLRQAGYHLTHAHGENTIARRP